MSIVGNMAGCYSPIGKTFTLVDENDNEITGVVVDQEVIFTAGDNDVREGSVYASDSGISTGTKVIPAYTTSAGSYLILPNERFSVPFIKYDLYDYTVFQCMISIVNPDDLDNSVNTSMISFNNVVFNVNSTTKIAEVTKNLDAKSIDLNMINDSEDSYYIHYFTYRQEE